MLYFRSYLILIVITFFSISGCNGSAKKATADTSENTANNEVQSPETTTEGCTADSTSAECVPTIPVTPVDLDADDDGINDTLDNCVNLANPDQLDTDDNGVGDLCDLQVSMAHFGDDWVRIVNSFPTSHRFQANVKFGTAPYALSWNFDGASPDLTGPGPHTINFPNRSTAYKIKLTVTDSNGQQVVRTIWVAKQSSIVPFDDAQMEQVIRESISGYGHPIHTGNITVDQIQGVRDVYADNRGIKDLEGMQFLNDVAFIDLSNNPIQDLFPLVSVKSISSTLGLYLANCNIQNVGIFADNKSIASLNLIDNNINNIKFVSRTNLKLLFLDRNPVSDLSPLLNLNAFTVLSFLGHRFTSADLDHLVNISTLDSLVLDKIAVPVEELLDKVSSMQNLVILHIKNISGLIDVSKLANLAKLYYINLDGTDITDISSLAGLPNLLYLSLVNTPFIDFQSLQNFTVLKHIDLGKTTATNLNGLEDHPSLTGIGLSESSITDLSVLSTLLNLNHIVLNKTKVTDFSPLYNLPNLNNFYLENNNDFNISWLSELDNLKVLSLIGTSIQGGTIASLAALSNLRAVDLRNTNITDLTPLIDNPDFKNGDELVIKGLAISPEQIQLLLDKGVVVIQ